MLHFSYDALHNNLQQNKTDCIFVAATYIRLLHGKIGFFWGGGGVRPQLRIKGSDPYSAWMKYVVCLHLLYIPLKFGERWSTPRGATGPSLLVRERSALATLIFTLRVCLSGCLSFCLLVRERSALATLIFTSRVCLSVILSFCLSVRNFGAKYLGNEAR